ncbi:C-C motif chemokine 5-like [Gopherus evgoodei]|uniref:C-C motif chemokine n=1 Tax=Gopherus evgoodei TaxID=1825980 RepID=A0A8C4Y8N6_9SAUR|nr:C-C motif chemokine 5-like [Gopherus evgoodei]
MQLVSRNKQETSLFPYKTWGLSPWSVSEVRGPCSAPTVHPSPDSNMKATVAALAVLLVAAFCSLASSAPLGSDTTVCCFSYATRKLPQSHLKEYFYTSGKCSQPAVVFVTRKNKQVCANPDTKWVKDYVNFLEMK